MEDIPDWSPISTSAGVLSAWDIAKAVSGKERRGVRDKGRGEGAHPYEHTFGPSLNLGAKRQGSREEIQYFLFGEIN